MNDDDAWKKIQAEKKRNCIKDSPALEAGLIADCKSEIKTSELMK